MKHAAFVSLVTVPFAFVALLNGSAIGAALLCLIAVGWWIVLAYHVVYK